MRAMDDVHWIKERKNKIKHNHGVHVIDLEKQYEHSTATICTLMMQESSKQNGLNGIHFISIGKTDLIYNLWHTIYDLSYELHRGSN